VHPWVQENVGDRPPGSCRSTGLGGAPNSVRSTAVTSAEGPWQLRPSFTFRNTELGDAARRKSPDRVICRVRRMGTDSVHRVSHVGVYVSSSLTGGCSASGDIPRPAPGAWWPLLHPVVAARFRSFRETNSRYGSHMTLTDDTTDLPEPQPNGPRVNGTGRSARAGL
jgi:hypothetical protein